MITSGGNRNPANADRSTFGRADRGRRTCPASSAGTDRHGPGPAHATDPSRAGAPREAASLRLEGMDVHAPVRQVGSSKPWCADGRRSWSCSGCWPVAGRRRPVTVRPRRRPSREARRPRACRSRTNPRSRRPPRPPRHRPRTAPTTTPPVATPPRTTPAGRPCPADVAATLPDSRSATLVAGFRTSRFRLYYCRTAGGQLYYRGISRADAAKATTLPARRIAGGFEARGLEEGSVFVFRVAQGRLFVIQDGKQIFVDPIIATL